MALSHDMKRLTEEYTRAYDGRMAVLAGIRDGAANARRQATQQVAALDTAHRSMSAELDKRLSGEYQQLKTDVDKLLDEAAALLKAIDNTNQTMATELGRQLGAQLVALRHNGVNLRKQMNAAHQGMSTMLRKWLHEAHRVRANERKRMGAEIMATRTSLRRDQEEGRRAWSQFSAIMRQRRAGYTAAPAPVARVAPAPVARAAPAPAAPAAPAPALPAEVPLSERVMEFLRAHPEGVKPTELEETFHLNRSQMARQMNELIASGKVRRDDETRLYFVA